VIAAAGSGQRLGAGGPKAFVPLAGRAMVEWSIVACRAAPSIRAIVVACPPGHVHDLAGGDVGVVDGGATRAESVANALAGVNTELVAIHDAARPLATPDLIEEVVATLAANPDAAGAIAAAPVTDTIKQLGESAKRTLCTPGVHNVRLEVEATLDRERLWAAQTPQVFRGEALRAALRADPKRLSAATDEAMMVEAEGGRVLIHSSSPENLKVTTQLDLQMAEVVLLDREAQAGRGMQGGR
jgi:2-C-methyl-D-erythritol 4-phosphate cytidylyltransferase